MRRKGYGSVSLVSLKVNGTSVDVETTPEAYARALKDSLVHDLSRMGRKTIDSVPFTAFSSHACHVIVRGSRDSPMELLDRIGSEMVRYRSWGRKPKGRHEHYILGDQELSESNFEFDHDLMKRRGSRKRHPQRVAFGLPHNYGKQRSEQVDPNGDFDRRASPLFLHISQHSEQDDPFAVVTFLPSSFLPRGGKEVNVGGSSVSLDRSEAFWKTLTDFMNRLHDPDEGGDAFRGSRMVTYDGGAR